MHRVTNNVDYCETYCETSKHKCPIYSNCINRLSYEKAKLYEDAEEQGLLFKFELSVGDEFWELNNNHLEPCIYPRKAHSLQHVVYCMERLGKVTFLTKEDAEQALKQMGE